MHLILIYTKNLKFLEKINILQVLKNFNISVQIINLYKLQNDNVKQIRFTKITKRLLFNQMLSTNTGVKAHC